jgi:hypothetical protein
MGIFFGLLSCLMLAFPVLAHAQYSQAEIDRAIKQAGGLENFLLYMVKQSNKQMPVRIDDEHEITMATLPTSKSIGYNTRLTKHESYQIKQNKASLSRSLYNHSRNVICTSPVSKTLVGRYDVSYKYQLYSKSGEYILQYEINKEDCLRRN